MIDKETDGCGGITGIHRKRVSGDEAGDPWGRSEVGDQSGLIGTLLRVLKEIGAEGKTTVGGATNESRGHSFCFRARGSLPKRKRLH